MIELLTLIGLSIVVFVSTNIDDIFLLLGFFADRRLRASRIATGQLLGISVLVGASVLASLISLIVSPAYVGLLGLLPIGIGVKGLLEIGGGSDLVSPHEARGDAFGQIASVAAVTIANGGDNLGVYIPWFAILSAGQILVVVLVFAAMTILWLVTARWLVDHRTVGSPIRQYGHLAMPFVLLALGVWIVHQAGSLELFR